MSKALGRLSSFLLAGSALWLAGCGSKDDPETAAYAKLEGVYELVEIDRFAEACDDEGTPATLPNVPNLWVAYVVEQGVPDAQLHAHGCADAERCRKQATDVQADGEPSYATDFARYVYSRVADDGAIDGVGVNLIGVVAQKCQLELEEAFVRREGDETLFSARYRFGAEYDPEPDGSCAAREDLASQWRSWTDHACTHFDVVHARFEDAL